MKKILAGLCALFSLNAFSASNQVVGVNAFPVVAGENMTGPVSVFIKSEKVLQVKSTNLNMDVVENGGSTVTVTVPIRYYLRNDLANNVNIYGLDEVLEDALNDSPSTSGVYTVAFDIATQKFTISATGLTSLSILFYSGPHGAQNSDTHIGTLLGCSDAADLTGSLSYTCANQAAFTLEPTAQKTDPAKSYAQSPSGYVTATVERGVFVNVQNTGIVSGFGSSFTRGQNLYTGATQGAVVGSSSVVQGSKSAGFATSIGSLFANFSLSSVVQFATTWLATPTSYDAGAEIQNGDMSCNASGHCVRTFIYTPAVGGTTGLRMQYSSSGGASWSTSASTLSFNGLTVQENFNGNYFFKPRIILDDSGYGVVIYSYNNGSGYNPTAGYTNDYGVTWTSVTLLASGAGTYYPGSLAIRQNKTVALFNIDANNDSKIFISNNTGSGYSTWSSAVSLTYDYRSTSPSWVGIQYFPAETGINKYRIVTLGEKFASTYSMAYHTFKGDGSSETYGYVADDSSGNEGVPIAVGIDQSGTKNIIVVLQGYIGGSFSKIRQAESNEGYNSGTLTWNNHGLQDINSGGPAIDRYNGYSSVNDYAITWNINNRLVVYGNYAYAIVQTNANPGSLPAATLFSTTNLTGGTWTSTNVGLQAGSVQEVSLCHIPANDGLMLVYKYNTNGLANNLVNGQIWARYAERNASTGALTWFDHVQIDGGKAMAGFAGFAQAVCTQDKAVVTWEQYNGSSYDLLKGTVNY